MAWPQIKSLSYVLVWGPQVGTFICLYVLYVNIWYFISQFPDFVLTISLTLLTNVFFIVICLLFVKHFVIVDFDTEQLQHK